MTYPEDVVKGKAIRNRKGSTSEEEDVLSVFHGGEKYVEASCRCRKTEDVVTTNITRLP